MLLEEVLGAWNSFLCSGKLPPSLCFANCAFLLNRCFGNRGRIIKYLLCQKVDLCCSTLSINLMFLPRKSPLKIQLDYNYCTFALIDVESSLPFWLLPSSFSAYRATKLIRNRRKGSWVAPKWERRNHPKCRCVTKQVPAPVSAWLFQIPGEHLSSLFVGKVGWPHEALLLMPKCQCSHWSMTFYITPHKAVLILNI